jgi:hypothetical protein
MAVCKPHACKPYALLYECYPYTLCSKFDTLVPLSPYTPACTTLAAACRRAPQTRAPVPAVTAPQPPREHSAGRGVTAHICPELLVVGPKRLQSGPFAAISCSACVSHRNHTASAAHACLAAANMHAAGQGCALSPCCCAFDEHCDQCSAHKVLPQQMPPAVTPHHFLQDCCGRV